MTNIPNVPSPSSPYSPEYNYPHTGYRAHWCHTICWRAIFAGLAAALACDVLLMMLSAGLGFAIYTPITDENPIENFSTGAIVITGFSAVVSLFLGGWVAGRVAPVIRRGTGCMHGFLVWCSATVAGVIFVAIGAGWALGDLSKLVGGGLSLAGKPAAAAVGGAADLAKNAAQSAKDSLASFTDEAIGNRAANNDSTPGAAIRAKREIGLAIARLFNPAQSGNAAANRTALISTLASNTSLSQADAERLVNEWTASYDRLKADLAAVKERAELKAREAAQAASNALAIFSLCTFFGFLIGAIAAGYGGCAGAKRALKYYEADRVVV